MGSTDSKTDKSRLQRQYRLVRRFISQFYGGGQITIIEHKQTKQQVALKEIVNQFNPQLLMKQLQARKLLNHKNIIQLRTYWLENDLNICSNLFKLYAVFQYHQNTLQDLLAQKSNQKIGDAETADFVRQMLGALAFMQRNQMIYLLAGPKSIVVGQQQEAGLRERPLDDDQVYYNRINHFKMLRQINDKQRCSLADLNRRYFASQNNNSFRAEQKQKEIEKIQDHSQLQLYLEKGKRKIYKLFESFQGLTATKSFYSLNSYMQVPLHPELATSSQDQILLPEYLIKLQNLFTVVLIALAMCEGCDIFDLDVLKNGKLSIQKLKAKIEALQESHPKTSRDLLKVLAIRGLQKQGNFSRSNGQHSLKLKDFSFILKRQDNRSASKQNKLNVPGVTFADKKSKVISRKRISLLQY